ncbi:histidine phosphatase family protein [soil metagenome]
MGSTDRTSFLHEDGESFREPARVTARRVSADRFFESRRSGCETRVVNAHTTLALVRHGETDWNAQKRLQGSSDIPLNDTGRAQVRATAVSMRGDEWDFIVCSPLSRARESAEILGAELGIEVIGQLPAIVERDYGPAEGLQDSEELRALRIPGGFIGAETEEEVSARSTEALTELVSTHRGKRIIVVAHGTLIRLAMKTLTGEPIDTISNAAHSVMLHSRAEDDTHLWRVVVVNGVVYDESPLSR